jgi:hypothetical protein
VPHKAGPGATLLCAEFGGFTIPVDVPSMTATAVADACADAVNRMSSYSCQPVVELWVDAENVCVSQHFKSAMAGLQIRVQASAPTYHQCRAERIIQDVKLMAARIEGSLLWELRRIPNEEHHLYAHLCYARAHLARQDGGTGVTPYLQLTGRARSWHGVPLLDYGCVVMALRTPRELAQLRARGELNPLNGEPGILLGFSDFAGSGRRFYRFDTGRVQIRRECVRLDVVAAAQLIPPQLLVSRATRLQGALEAYHALDGGPTDGVQFPLVNATDEPSPARPQQARPTQAPGPASTAVTELGAATADIASPTDQLLPLAALETGDDVSGQYREHSEYFPARILRNDPAAGTATVRYLVQSAGTEETLSYAALKSATLTNRRKLRPRQQQSRVQQPNAWLALHPSGTHGEALPEYRRQASAMDAIDAAIAVLGQPVSSIQVAAQARRDYALSQAELSAVTRQLPTRVDPIAISDSGVPMMLPALVPLIRIPHGPAAKWCWRHVDGRLEEWTEDRALAYLAAGLESHLRPQLAIPVALTINKRSARAAMKPNAQRREDAAKAIRAEADQFLRNNVVSAPIRYEDIPSEHKGKILRAFQFVVDKLDADGTFVKCKARTVVDGSKQHPDTHGPTSSPVMASATMRLLLAQAAHLKRKVASLDIIEAFCNVHNPFKSYLELPPELHEILGRYVELLKCLYGTKQAAREFYEMLAAGLLKHGYNRCSVDAALFKKCVGGSWVHVGIHVDDTLITYDAEAGLEDLHAALVDTFGKDKVKLEKQPTTFLGLQVKYNADGSLALGQRGYILNLCERFSGFLSDRAEAYPHDSDTLAVTQDSRRAEPLSASMAKAYLTLVGSLGYCIHTYASIQASLTYLQSRSSCPCVGDWEKGIRMLRFLRTHQNQMVVFPGPCGPDATEEEIESRFRLWITVDSSHNACPDGKGITGITASLGEWCTPFLCVAAKQRSVGMSTADTEHYGFGEAVAKIRWIRHIAEFIGYHSVQPIRVENDNMAALSLASMPFIGKGVRHASVRSHFFKEAILDGTVVFVWRPTHQLLADFLTKPVTGPHFAKLDDWIRCGLPWADRPILPPQPNAVFDIGVTAGADKFLQTITPRSAIVSSVSTADNFLSLCGQSAKLSEIDLGCVDLIDLFRVGSKDQSLH